MDDELFDPFAEEFEIGDVVNKTELDTGFGSKNVKERVISNVIKKGLSEEDIDQLVNYDQNRRKSLQFKNEINDEVVLDENKKFDLPNEFKDFLVAPKITGRGIVKGNARYYPNSIVNRTDNTVEITSTPYQDTKKHDKSTVIVNRDERGDVDNIEIVCSCGERLLLKFDIVDQLDLEKTKVIVPKVEYPENFNIAELEEKLSITEEMMYAFDDFNLEGYSELEETPKKKVAKPKKIEEKTSDLEINQDEDFWNEEFPIDDSDLDMGSIDLSGI